MDYSTGTSPSGSHDDRMSSLTYYIVFVIGFVLLILLIIMARWICFQAERQVQDQHFMIRLAAGLDLRGINAVTLSRFPKLRYSEAKLGRGGKPVVDSVCSICLADYKESDLLRPLPHCGHLFHVKCIDPWLRMHLTCPICRTPPVPEIRVTVPETGRQPLS